MSAHPNYRHADSCRTRWPAARAFRTASRLRPRSTERGWSSDRGPEPLSCPRSGRSGRALSSFAPKATSWPTPGPPVKELKALFDKSGNGGLFEIQMGVHHGFAAAPAAARCARQAGHFGVLGTSLRAVPATGWVGLKFLPARLRGDAPVLPGGGVEGDGTIVGRMTLVGADAPPPHLNGGEKE